MSVSSTLDTYFVNLMLVSSLIILLLFMYVQESGRVKSMGDLGAFNAMHKDAISS